MNRIEQVLFSLQWQYLHFWDSFSWNLDTKFCLHDAGGICVHNSFTNSEGEIQISGSSAYSGGAVLRSFSRVCQNFEMAVGSVRSTLGSENRKRIEEISIDFHDLLSMFATKLDCQLVQVFVVVPVPFVSREQDGCLRLSLFLNMNLI